MALWNVCGFATKERNNIELAEQLSKRDQDIVGVQGSWDSKRGGGIICKVGVGEYAWIGKKRKGQDNKNRGAGGVGFLVKGYLCDIIEVIKETKFDEDIRIKERGAKYFLLRKHLYAPRVEEYGKIYTEEVRRSSSRCT